MTITLYQRVAEDLIGKIRSGHWPEGAVLPSELLLMEQYGTSRNTIRTALKQLEDMGLVSRKRNRGTQVIAQPSAQAFTQSLTTLDDLVSFASAAKRQVVDSHEMVMDKDVARELGCAPGSRWMHISMERREAEARIPLAWTDAFVDPHYAEISSYARAHPDKLLCDLLEQHYGRRVSVIEQAVSSCSVPESVAQRLAMQHDGPGLKVVRRYRDAAKAIVLVTRSYYAGERYTLETTLVRDLK